jgi:hypothetical protein
MATETDAAHELKAKIDNQGIKVRELKSKSSSKVSM